MLQKMEPKTNKGKGVNTLNKKIAGTHSHYRFWSELPTQNYSHYRFWSKTLGKGVNPKAKCDHIFTSLTTLLLRSVQIAAPFAMLDAFHGNSSILEYHGA